MNIPEWVTLLATMIVALLLAQAVKIVYDKIGKEPSRVVVTIIVAVVSIGLSFFVVRPTLPGFEDPMAFIEALILIASSIMGVATILYNLILDKVFTAIGFITATYKSRLKAQG